MQKKIKNVDLILVIMKIFCTVVWNVQVYVRHYVEATGSTAEDSVNAIRAGKARNATYRVLSAKTRLAVETENVFRDTASVLPDLLARVVNKVYMLLHFFQQFSQENSQIRISSQHHDQRFVSPDLYGGFSIPNSRGRFTLL